MKHYGMILSVAIAASCAVSLVGCPGGLLGAPAIDGVWKFASVHEEGNSFVEGVLTFGELKDGKGSFSYVETSYSPLASESVNKEYVLYASEGTYKLSKGLEWAQGSLSVTLTSQKRDKTVYSNAYGSYGATSAANSYTSQYASGVTTHTLVDVEFDKDIPLQGRYAYDAFQNLLFAWDSDTGYIMTLTKE